MSEVSSAPAPVVEAPAAPAPVAPVAPAAPPVDWKSHVPQSLVRDTPEATLAEVGKAYKNLESKLGQRQQPQPSQTGLVPTAPSLSDDAGFEDIVKAAGYDPMTFLAEVHANGGQVTDEQLANIRKGMPGAPRKTVNDMVQARIEVSSVRQQTALNDAHQMLGGKDRFEWAMANLKNIVPADRYEAIASGLQKFDTYKASLEAVALYMGQSVPKRGNSVITGNGSAGAQYPSGAFASQDEMNAAFRDPRYAPSLPGGLPNPKHDPNYRASVLKRAAASRR